MTVSEAQERVAFLIRLMRKSLADYTEGRAELGRLTGDLQSLIDALEEVADVRRVERLRSSWGELEIIYAIALDEGRPLTADEERDVQAIVEELNEGLQEPCSGDR